MRPSLCLTRMLQKRYLKAFVVNIETCLTYSVIRILRGPLEQIKFLLGHSSIQTTERYLGSEQEIAVAVNDNLGL
jgi:hypothetical protein